MIKGIYGFNIAVKDLESAKHFYEGLFGVTGKTLAPSDFAIEGIEGVHMNVGGLHVNLISSPDPNTSVGRFLQKKGEGFFLLSIEVDDMEKDMKALQSRNVEFAFDTAFEGDFGKVNFAHPRCANGIQLEFFQPKEAS